MDQIDWLRFVLSFVFVLGLLGITALALRRWGGKFIVPRVAKGKARLGVLEACYLAPRQRLVLVKRDTVEHLLLLNGDRAQLVETIARAEENA